MEVYLNAAQNDFNDFINNHQEYSNRVNELNGLFGFIGNNALKGNLLPTYYSGNLLGQRHVIIGINPGYNETNNNWENLYRTLNWEQYRNFHDNFFDNYQNGGFNINYYRYMAGVLAPDDIRFNNWNYFNYCHNAVLNIDIIPYHSYGFNHLALNVVASNYILDRFYYSILPLLQRNINNVNTVIIHDRRLFLLLRDSNFFNDQHIVYNHQTNNGLREIYSVQNQGIDFRIFSRYIPNGGFSRQIVQQYL